MLKVFIVSLILVLPSCSGSDNLSALRNAIQKKRQSAAQAPGEQIARSDGLVTLKPPYTGLKYDNNDPEPRISLQNAIDVIARQAGMSYNRSESFKNTNPLCRQWVYPDFENKPWKEAIEEVLAPFKLTYIMENNKVVLMKPEDALKFEQEVQKVQADMAAILESGKELQRLHDAVIIFPLLDSRGLTTHLGTLLSELAMLKLTYVPEKKLNLHFPSVVEFYHSYGYDLPGNSVTTEEWNNILLRFDSRDSAAGTLELPANGRYKISLSFNGRNGKREFSTSGAEDTLYTVPEWMAQCAHEYCGIALSPLQQQYVKSPEISATTSLYELMGLEHDFWSRKKSLVSWRHFIKKNPASVFALYRLAAISEHEEQDNSIQLLTEGLHSIGEHDLLKFFEAEWHQRKEQQYESVPRYLRLYRNDYRNEVLLARLDEALLGLGMGADAAALHDLWEKTEPNSALPLYAKGDFYIEYGWEARGSGFASTVTEDGWKKLEERLAVAEQCLKKALELSPDDPRVATTLIRVAVGRRYDREQMEKWFQMAIQADPMYLPAYQAKLRYLMPKWYGDYEGNDMFGFVRECRKTAPEEVNVAELFQSACSEMGYRWADRHDKDWTEYYTQPGVWKEIKTFYEQWLNEHPDSITDRNYYAKSAFYAHDYGEAVRQFKIIGKDIDKECWSEKYFYQCRTRSYEQTGRI
jgi:tetratricopeptide (TPR) repeat protein